MREDERRSKKHELHVIKGDRVKVIAGKDKGLVGEVIAVHPEATSGSPCPA